jgi:hypothetical protein
MIRSLSQESLNGENVESMKLSLESRVYMTWDYFGETAVLSSKAHTTTMICIGKFEIDCKARWMTNRFITIEFTVLLMVPKVTFNSLMIKDVAKLAEFKIKSMNSSVPIEFVMIHPTGRQLMTDFLKKEHSEENCNFYDAVVRFEEMILILAERIEADAQSKSVDAIINSRRPSQQGSELQLNISNSIQSRLNWLNTVREDSKIAVTEALIISKQNSEEKSKSKKSVDLSGKRGSMSSRLSSRSQTSSARQHLIDFAFVVNHAKDIIETFIETDSAQCVNISHDLREQVLQNYALWLQLFNNHDKHVHALRYEKHAVNVALGLFVTAKEKVLELLSKDAYPRLKRTLDFKEFIKSFRPKRFQKKIYTNEEEEDDDDDDEKDNKSGNELFTMVASLKHGLSSKSSKSKGI